MESSASHATEPLEREPRRPPLVYGGVSNWWYHYYSWGFNRRIRTPRPIHFTLAPYKVTPDFHRLVYDFEICHPQLSDVEERKSLIVIKTAIGMRDPPSGYVRTRSYVVGVMRVGALRDGKIFMDPKDSLLLLSYPIEMTQSLARMLFPKRPPDYWSNERRTLAAKLGSLTRNRHLELFQAEHLISELVQRYNNGATNYLGERYEELIRTRKPGRRLEDFF